MKNGSMSKRNRVKGILIFVMILAVLFLALAVMNHLQTQSALAGNPYQKSTLHPETIKQLGNPAYQNIILPDQLEQQLVEKKTFYAYFYSPLCSVCQAVTPQMDEAAKTLNIDVKMYNLLEFEEGWNRFKLEKTPTLIYFKDGKEVERFVGAAPYLDVFQMHRLPKQ